MDGDERCVVLLVVEFVLVVVTKEYYYYYYYSLSKSCSRYSSVVHTVLRIYYCSRGYYQPLMVELTLNTRCTYYHNQPPTRKWTHTRSPEEFFSVSGGYHHFT